MDETTFSKSVASGDLSGTSTYSAGIVQANAHRALRRLTDSLLKPYGLTTMHWFILGTIYDATDGINASDISAKLGTTLAYITTAANVLEARSMIERINSPTDNRYKTLHITAGFSGQCIEIETYLRQKLRDSVYAKVGPEDFRAYLKVTCQLSKV